MAEINFSIPITGTIDVHGETVTIRVNESVLTLKLATRESPLKRLKLEPGQTLFDLVIETARSMVADSGVTEFTAADLYHLAEEKYPHLNLKSNSWTAHVVSSAPNHPSYRHSTARRRYFRFLGKGKYALDPTLPAQSQTASDSVV